jgi:hypothetical protein
MVPGVVVPFYKPTNVFLFGLLCLRKTDSTNREKEQNERKFEFHNSTKKEHWGTAVSEILLGTLWGWRSVRIEVACGKSYHPRLAKSRLTRLPNIDLLADSCREQVPAQPVDATPSNSLIRQCFPGRSDLFGCTRSKPSQGSVPADLTLASDLAFVFNASQVRPECCVDPLRPPGLSLLHFEIAGAKRISRHLSGPSLPTPSAKPSFRLRDLSGADHAEPLRVPSGHTEARWKI